MTGGSTHVVSDWVAAEVARRAVRGGAGNYHGRSTVSTDDVLASLTDDGYGAHTKHLLDGAQSRAEGVLRAKESDRFVWGGAVQRHFTVPPTTADDMRRKPFSAEWDVLGGYVDIYRDTIRSYGGAFDDDDPTVPPILFTLPTTMADTGDAKSLRKLEQQLEEAAESIALYRAQLAEFIDRGASSLQAED